jgi:hypothetical protein
MIIFLSLALLIGFLTSTDSNLDLENRNGIETVYDVPLTNQVTYKFFK